ncbi:MAG TPA: hypothetical protein DC049_05280, partial [Spirochaetia bacterium]|nr:hypothetical protein [Spirochaetia bacterium]
MKHWSLAIIISFLIMACSRKNEPFPGSIPRNGPPGKNEHGFNGPGERKPFGGREIKVCRTNITLQLEESGKIAPQTSAEIKSRISGRVVFTSVKEGDLVRAGQTLARIEPDLSQAKIITSLINSLKKTEMEYHNAQKEYERQNELQERGFIAVNTLDTARDNLSRASMEYKSAREEYELFRKETGAAAAVNSTDLLTVISPLNGIILSKDVENGELVSGESSAREGTVLFTAADISTLIIKININEIDKYKVRKGDQVEISIPANPYTVYTGTIINIAPQGEIKNNAVIFPAEISINRHDERLSPGMSATVKININARKNVLSVPVTALFVDKSGEYVYTAGERGRLQKVYVKRGLNDEKNVEI